MAVSSVPIVTVARRSAGGKGEAGIANRGANGETMRAV
jgi:hypothetical protein